MTAWSPTDLGVQQICHLLAEIQKPGTNQAQVISRPSSLLSKDCPLASERNGDNCLTEACCTQLGADLSARNLRLATYMRLLLSLQVLSQLEQYTKYPDFNNYLAYIFADGENLSIEVSIPGCRHSKE